MWRLVVLLPLGAGRRRSEHCQKRGRRDQEQGGKIVVSVAVAHRGIPFRKIKHCIKERKMMETKMRE